MSLLCVFDNRECHIYISYYSVRECWSPHVTREAKSCIALFTNTVRENISVRLEKTNGRSIPKAHHIHKRGGNDSLKTEKDESEEEECFLEILVQYEN